MHKSVQPLVPCFDVLTGLTTSIWSCQSRALPQSEAVTFLCIYISFITCSPALLCKNTQITARVRYSYATKAGIHTCRPNIHQLNETQTLSAECRVIFPCHWQPAGSQQVRSHFTKSNLRASVISGKVNKPTLLDLQIELSPSDFLLEPQGFCFNGCCLRAIIFCNSECDIEWIPPPLPKSLKVICH